MLKQRIITAIIAVAAVVCTLWGGGWLWDAFVTVGCLLCLYEFCSIVDVKPWSVAAGVGYLWVAFAIVWPSWVSQGTLAVLMLFTFVVPVVTKNQTPVARAGVLVAGALYIGFAGIALRGLRELPHGLLWVLVTLVAIWATDTGAFFVGSWLRGPKLWPEISPNKTISGAVAGLLCGGLGCWLISRFGLYTHSGWYFFGLGAVLSLAGQFGDLAESAYKRSAGVKDSGRLLPGHGGVLDRVDSVLFAAPVAYLIVSTPWHVQ